MKGSKVIHSLKMMTTSLKADKMASFGSKGRVMGRRLRVGRGLLWITRKMRMMMTMVIVC